MQCNDCAETEVTRNYSFLQGALTKANLIDILPSVQLFQLVLYIPTFIFGFIFNILALWMLFFRIKKWIEATTYMTAQIAFDSLLLVTLPFKIKAYRLGESWNLGFGPCTFLESLYFVNMYGSILISVCICIDRYLAIQFPFYSKLLRSPKKAVVVCALVCIMVWGTSIGFLVNLRDANESHCFYGFSNRTWSNRAMVAILETMFLISTFLLLVCTTQIILTLKKKEHSNTKVIKVLVANLVTFLLSFVPFHLSLLLYYLAKNDFILEDYKEQLRIFLQISLSFSNINCFLDGVCYYFILREFEKSNMKLPVTG